MTGKKKKKIPLTQKSIRVPVRAETVATIIAKERGVPVAAVWREAMVRGLGAMVRDELMLTRKLQQIKNGSEQDAAIECLLQIDLGDLEGGDLEERDR